MPEESDYRFDFQIAQNSLRPPSLPLVESFLASSLAASPDPEMGDADYILADTTLDDDAQP